MTGCGGRQERSTRFDVGKVDSQFDGVRIVYVVRRFEAGCQNAFCDNNPFEIGRMAGGCAHAIGCVPARSDVFVST